MSNMASPVVIMKYSWINQTWFNRGKVRKEEQVQQHAKFHTENPPENINFKLSRSTPSDHITIKDYFRPIIPI